MKSEEKLDQCYEAVKDQLPFVPKLALILGSGLGDYADHVTVEKVIPYESIEGFPRSTVAGHKGQFVYAKVEGVPTVMMQGRVHYYEGYPMQDVVLPVRLMKKMGAEILFLTNAAGGVNENLHAGEPMMITEQISSFVPSPLIGANREDLGPRFPDMSEIYRREYRKIIRESSKALNIDLQEGTYLQFTGPAYESPAEIRMVRTLGADAVGMSTACEAVAANHMGMKVCGISCITNMAAGILDQPLDHKEVQEVADRVKMTFERLVTEIVTQL